MGVYADKLLIEQKQEQIFRQVINEAYFGRTPGITRCFNAFCDFRRKYVSDNYIANDLRGIRHLDADHDKDLLRFVSEMERQFGFHSFSFVIKNDTTANMYTYPVLIGKNRLTGKPKDFIYVDKEGYHYKKDVEMSCIVCAYTQMLFDNRLSDEETFAIVLHEIGHNFQQFLNNDMFSLNLIYQMLYLYSLLLELIYIIQDPMEILSILQGLVSIEPIHKEVSKLYKNITSDYSKNNIYSYFNFIRGLLSIGNLYRYVAMLPMAPIMGVISGLISIVSSLISVPISTYNYLGEQMADNFPTYYGFGEAAVSSQLNMPYSPFGPAVDMVKSIPVIGHLYNLTLLPGEILVEIGDCHPANPVRAKSMINSMKTDLNDPSLNPKLRKELKKQIDDIEKATKSYYDKATKIDNPDFVKEAYDKWIFYNMEGGLKYKTHRSIFNLDKGVQQQTANLKECYILNTKII